MLRPPSPRGDAPGCLICSYRARHRRAVSCWHLPRAGVSLFQVSPRESRRPHAEGRQAAWGQRWPDLEGLHSAGSCTGWAVSAQFSSSLALSQRCGWQQEQCHTLTSPSIGGWLREPTEGNPTFSGATSWLRAHAAVRAPRHPGRQLTRTSLNRLLFRRRAPMEAEQWATTGRAASRACRPPQHTTKQQKWSLQQKQLAKYRCSSSPEGFAPLPAVSGASQSCFPPPSSPHVAVLAHILSCWCPAKS